MAKLATSPKAEKSSATSSAAMDSGMPATKSARPAGRSSAWLLCGLMNRCFEYRVGAWMMTFSVLKSAAGATICRQLRQRTGMRRRRRDAMQSSRCRRAGRGPVWLRRVLQVLRHLRNLRNGSVSRMRKLQVPAGSRDSNEEMPFCPLSSSALRPVRCSRQVTPQFALRRAPTPDIYCFGSFRILVRRSPSTRSRCRRRNSLPFAQMDFVDRAASRQRMLLNHLRPVSVARDVVSIHNHASQCSRTVLVLNFIVQLTQGMDQAAEAVSQLQVHPSPLPACLLNAARSARMTAAQHALAFHITSLPST